MMAPQHRETEGVSVSPRWSFLPQLLWPRLRGVLADHSPARRGTTPVTVSGPQGSVSLKSTLSLRPAPPSLFLLCLGAEGRGA